MTARLFFKLIFGIFCLLAVALLAVDFFASQVAESSYIQNLTRELGDKGRMLALSLGDGSQSSVHAMARAAGARITLVALDGRVLADSEANPAQMENHSHRPEIVEAFRGSAGSSIRQSPTMGVKFLYVAVPVPAGALRLAVPLSEINEHVNAIRRRMLASTALAFLPAIVIAALFARAISARFAKVIDYAAELARGNFQARLRDVRGGEFGMLAGKLNETAANLQKTVQQLDTEHAELEKLERIRKDFVINVSHELRTPLASIQGYTETLMDGAIHDQENNIRFLGIIRHNAERLVRLTADLLTLSRIEMKRQEFRFAPYRINELIGDVLDTIRPIAEKNRLRLVQELAPQDTEVFCDSEALHQIMSNLLDNAIKYTPQGGVITAGARAVEQRRERRLEIFVRDTGAGIPAEDLPRLFERFYRVDKARSRELGGTGLGLAIVKHLALAHGSEVRVDSRMGEGSTFYFTVQLAQEPAALQSASSS